eukprot:g30016.t1
MNLANLGGVMFYLHNEVVDKEGEMRDASGARTTKFQVDRILRFKVTVKNSAALWKKFRSQFGQFIQFDYGQATFGMPDHVKKCNAIWSEFGYEVGCQANPTGISGYDDGYWTGSRRMWGRRLRKRPEVDHIDRWRWSDPPRWRRTTQCIKEQPGGSCGSPNGSFDCIWNVAEAGFVMLDDLVGTDIKKLYEAAEVTVWEVAQEGGLSKTEKMKAEVESGQLAEIKWCSSGSALLVHCTTEVDDSGKSYYGVSKLLLASAGGGFQKDGAALFGPPL